MLRWSLQSLFAYRPGSLPLVSGMRVVWLLCCLGSALYGCLGTGSTSADGNETTPSVPDEQPADTRPSECLSGLVEWTQPGLFASLQALRNQRPPVMLYHEAGPGWAMPIEAERQGWPAVNVTHIFYNGDIGSNTSYNLEIRGTDDGAKVTIKIHDEGLRGDLDVARPILELLLDGSPHELDDLQQTMQDSEASMPIHGDNFEGGEPSYWPNYVYTATWTGSVDADAAIAQAHQTDANATWRQDLRLISGAWTVDAKPDYARLYNGRDELLG